MNSKKQLDLDMLLASDNPLQVYSISNEPELDYMIPDIERIIRSSREYRGFVYITKVKENESKCAATRHDTSQYNLLTMEIHHVIFLYDIVYTTGLAMIANLQDKEILTTFQIADKVIRDHLEGIIPTVAMLKSYHEMYHEGLYNFDKDDIHGDYTKWLNKYSDHITSNQWAKFNKLLLIDN